MVEWKGGKLAEHWVASMVAASVGQKNVMMDVQLAETMVDVWAARTADGSAVSSDAQTDMR